MIGPWFNEMCLPYRLGAEASWLKKEYFLLKYWVCIVFVYPLTVIYSDLRYLQKMVNKLDTRWLIIIFSITLIYSFLTFYFFYSFVIGNLKFKKLISKLPLRCFIALHKCKSRFYFYTL